MKKIIGILLIFVLIFGFGLVGCDNNNSVSQQFDKNKSYTIKLAAIQGSIWPPSPVSDDAVIEGILNKFKEKYPNIKVQLEKIERTKYSEYLSNKFMSGDVPDLFYIEPEDLSMVPLFFVPSPSLVRHPALPCSRHEPFGLPT